MYNCIYCSVLHIFIHLCTCTRTAYVDVRRYAVGPLVLSQYVNDAVTFELCIYRENTFFL